MAASIVIPTYNHAQWVGTAIESALAQNVRPRDVIVVDDGSIDSTATEIQNRFPQVTYLFKQNGGLASARNYGLSTVKTEYVCFLDDDDRLAPNFIERLEYEISNQADETGFAYASTQFTGSDTRFIEAPAWSVGRLKSSNFVSATSLFKMKAIGAHRFDENIVGWEDWEFALQLVAAGLEGLSVPDIHFYYHKHHDAPSMFDLLACDPLANLRAEKYIAKKHRSLYSHYERLVIQLRISKRLMTSGIRRVRVQ